VIVPQSRSNWYVSFQLKKSKVNNSGRISLIHVHLRLADHALSSFVHCTLGARTTTDGRIQSVDIYRAVGTRPADPVAAGPII